MPGTKNRTKKRRKRKPPCRTASATANDATPSAPPPQPNASAPQQKLCFLDSLEESDNDSEEEMDMVYEG